MLLEFWKRSVLAFSYMSSNEFCFVGDTSWKALRFMLWGSISDFLSTPIRPTLDVCCLNMPLKMLSPISCLCVYLCTHNIDFFVSPFSVSILFVRLELFTCVPVFWLTFDSNYFLLFVAWVVVSSWKSNLHINWVTASQTQLFTV